MSTCAPERVRIQFRYRRGQVVRYADRTTRHYRVTQQRYTRRDGLSPLYEYLLAPTNGMPTFWASEADLQPAAEGEGYA